MLDDFFRDEDKTGRDRMVVRMTYAKHIKN